MYVGFYMDLYSFKCFYLALERRANLYPIFDEIVDYRHSSILTFFG